MGELGVIPDEPWEEFSRLLSFALETFRVRVEVRRNDQEFSETGPNVDLYVATCLQLFNLMVEDLPVRHCASETCRRAFYRQIGRAEHGQYRTEGVVRYCSPSCANTQTQREYRRRKRAEKGGAK